MPTEHIVSLLIQERDKLNRAIEALQGPIKRRGRPPKGRANNTPPVPDLSVNAGEIVPGKRNPFSAATRRKMALAQQKR